MKKLVLWGALSVCGVLAPALPALAGRSTLCDDTLITNNTFQIYNPGYQKCITNGISQFTAGSGPAENSFLKSRYNLPLERQDLSTDNSKSPLGAFASIVQPSAPGGVLTPGVLTFDTVQTGFFVVGLQALDPTIDIVPVAKTVFYVFDYTGRAGTNRIQFDTLGIDDSLPALQVASLYFVPAAAVVPEPQSWALAALGLGALAFVRRRRDA